VSGGKKMEGQMRRDTIIKMLGEKGKPLSGTESVRKYHARLRRLRLFHRNPRWYKAHPVSVHHCGLLKPLKTLTGNKHFHTVEADSEQLLDIIEEKLREKGYAR